MKKCNFKLKFFLNFLLFLGDWPLRESSKRGCAGQERPECRHWHCGSTRLRRCHEATDQGAVCCSFDFLTVKVVYKIIIWWKDDVGRTWSRKILITEVGGKIFSCCVNSIEFRFDSWSLFFTRWNIFLQCLRWTRTEKSSMRNSRHSAAAPQSRPAVWPLSGFEVGLFRFWFFFLVIYNFCRKDNRICRVDQKRPDRQGTLPSAGQTSLLQWVF